MSEAPYIIVPGKKTRPPGFPLKMDAADFIGQMCQQFRVYHKEGSAEEAQWTDGMIAVLSGYTDDVLADACLWFWQHRKEIRFPLSAEIITVCDAIAKERVRPKLLAKEAQAVRASPYSPDRTDLVRHLLRSNQLALQAVKEGWIGALGDYVRVNARMPDVAEISKLKHSSRETTEALESVYRGDKLPADSILLAACRKAAGSIEQRRREYAAMVTGEAA